MSNKTIGVVGRGSGWQKVGIDLGSFVFHPNLSQPGMFQTFAPKIVSLRPSASVKRFFVCRIFLSPNKKSNLSIFMAYEKCPHNYGTMNG